MGGFFYAGEKKIRPDNYHRITNTGDIEAAGADEGIGAAAVTGNWGELNKVVTVASSDDYKKYIGSGSGYDVLERMFAGGVNTVKMVRVGSGGTAGSCTLTDTADTAADVLTLTAKYPGTRALSVSVKTSLADESVKDLTIYKGTEVLESYKLDAGDSEVTQAVSALAESAYVIATSPETGNGKLADASQVALSGGADPTVTNASYSAGLSALEAENWDSLCVDTNDTAVHALMQAFVDRIYEAGAYPLCTASEPSSVALETRMDHAAAFNDEKCHYVLDGWETSDGDAIEGYLAAAQIAGMIASIESNDSLTHKSITGAASLHESLTNTQIETALKKGCLVISASKTSGLVRIEKGINTLVSPAANQDDGWKKIRRTKTRFELMSRIDETIDELNGSINNDADGRAAIIAAGQSVLDAMVSEKKLLAGATMTEDSNNPAEGDSAWFLINADDIDSYEIGYLTYGYRFSQPTEE